MLYSFGSMLYMIVPCQQNVMSSFHCSLAYDFYIVIGLVGGLVGTFLIITKRLFEYYRAHKVLQ